MYTKKLLIYFITLFALYLIIELSIINLNHGHHVTYSVNDKDIKLNISETYTRRRKNEIDNYYFEIEANDTLFSIQIYEGFNKRNNIIDKIKYFEDEIYTCILPIFKGKKVLTDVICEKDNKYYNYSSIKNDDSKLDKFVSKLSKYGYDSNQYDDKLKKVKDNSAIIIYDNMIKNHYLSVENYKGIYLLSKNKIKNIKIFDNDVYTKTINLYLNKYYAVADYNEKYTFNELYLFDIKTGKKKTIITDRALDLDLNVQGYVDNKFYLYDKIDKVQYKVDIDSKQINKSGDSDVGIITYKNGSYDVSSAYNNNDIMFTSYSIDTNFNGKEYAKVDKVGNHLSGYYYLYEKKNDYYNVYQVNVQNKEVITYLFKTTDINSVRYYKNYIYYKDGTMIKYYNNFGSKTVIKYKELEFNKTLQFGLFAY